jgi:crotonobetainyl-CoA:carnitine CoA-transferase CaiB-like acyl-CoA transferase
VIELPESTQPPLAGSVVLSLGHTLPGLTCLAALRDLGAEVVRIERPARAGEAGPYAGLAKSFPTRSLLAGTSQLALDLKRDTGRDAFRRLAARADAVLEGFRPGVAQRLRIDHETLRADHPELVYAAISGYGQDSPWRERAGHDVNYLAETGVLALASPRGLPGTTFADGLAGLCAALNLVAALHAAAKTGRGAFLDLAIVDAPLFLMASELEHFWQTGESRGAGDTHLTGRYPWYGVHPTRDGGAVAVGAVEPPFHAALCRGIGRPELAASQLAQGEALAAARAAFAETFASRTREEALALFDGEDACVSPVLATAEVARSPLMQRALRTHPTTGEPIVRSPARLPPAPFAPERAGARVLERFGFSREEIDGLERDGAAGEP